MDQTDNKTVREQITARMIELRKANRYSQTDCADALGISQSSYAEMESGETKVRRRDMVTLAVFYGLHVDVAFPGLLEVA